MWPWFVLAAVIVSLVLIKDRNDKELQDQKDADEGLECIKTFLAESR